MIFDQSGSLANVSRHDYLPFGEELVNVGGRTTTQGYTGIVRAKSLLKKNGISKPDWITLAPDTTQAHKVDSLHLIHYSDPEGLRTRKHGTSTTTSWTIRLSSLIRLVFSNTSQAHQRTTSNESTRHTTPSLKLEISTRSVLRNIRP